MKKAQNFLKALRQRFGRKASRSRTLDKVAEKRKLMDQGIKKIKVSHGFTEQLIFGSSQLLCLQKKKQFSSNFLWGKTVNKIQIALSEKLSLTADISGLESLHSGLNYGEPRRVQNWKILMNWRRRILISVFVSMVVLVPNDFHRTVNRSF